MIADGLSPCGKMGLRVDCLLRGNLFRSPKARFYERPRKPCGHDARRFTATDADRVDAPSRHSSKHPQAPLILNEISVTVARASAEAKCRTWISNQESANEQPQLLSITGITALLVFPRVASSGWSDGQAQWVLAGAGRAVPTDVADVAGFVVGDVGTRRRWPRLRLLARGDVGGRQIKSIEALANEGWGAVGLNSSPHEVYLMDCRQRSRGDWRLTGFRFEFVEEIKHGTPRIMASFDSVELGVHAHLPFIVTKRCRRKGRHVSTFVIPDFGFARGVRRQDVNHSPQDVVCALRFEAVFSVQHPRVKCRTFQPIESFQDLLCLLGHTGRSRAHTVGAHCAVHFKKIGFDVRVGWKGSRRMRKPPAVVTVAPVQHLMDHLAKINLNGLRRNKSVVAEVSVLSTAISKGNNVRSEAEPWANNRWGMWDNETRRE